MMAVDYALVQRFYPMLRAESLYDSSIDFRTLLFAFMYRLIKKNSAWYPLLKYSTRSRQWPTTNASKSKPGTSGNISAQTSSYANKIKTRSKAAFAPSVPSFWGQLIRFCSKNRSTSAAAEAPCDTHDSKADTVVLSKRAEK